MENSFFAELSWKGAKEEVSFQLKAFKVTLLKGRDQIFTLHMSLLFRHCQLLQWIVTLSKYLDIIYMWKDAPIWGLQFDECWQVYSPG